MSNRSSQESEAESARSDFARRLRELRILRGFRTARSLARTLEIDENRYTRYERAEVEPDLDMIRRICATLAVSPSELLGHEARTPGGRAGPSGRRSAGQRPRAERAPAEADGALGLAAAAWELAAAVTRTRGTPPANGRETAGSPLADVSQTGTLYRSIMQQPFEAIAVLLQEPDVLGAPAEMATALRQRIDEVVRCIKQGPAGR